MSGKVGVIGLGTMGGAFARNLLMAGFRVIGYDIDGERLAGLVKLGGEAAAAPGGVAAEAGVSLLSLPSVAALDEVTESIARDGAGGAIVMECSTLPIDDKERSHEKLSVAGLTLLDCPISGTGVHAEKKAVTVFVSGDKAAYEKCVPVIEGFAHGHDYTGRFGNGSRMKFVANLLIVNHIASAAEAMVLGLKAGLDPQLVAKVIGASPAASEMFKVRSGLMAKGEYEPPMMTVELFQKDVDIIDRFIDGLAVDAPLFAAGAELFRRAMDEGLAAQDTASVCTLLERLSGVERRKE